MTILEGLAAANAAVNILKDLKDIDRNVDEAAYKLRIADTISALAEAKIALSDANMELNDNKVEILRLKVELQNPTEGDVCPKCREGRMNLLGTTMNRSGLANLGVEDWRYQCSQSDCDFEQRQIHDPHGAIPKAAAKRR